MASAQSTALRYFIAVAQHGSIRDAAESLHVAQSAISRQIMKAEEEWGMPLFERHARGVRLTAAGEIFLRYARDNVARIEQMRADIEALKGFRRGSIRMHVVEVLAHDFLPGIIGQFSERYPGLTFDIVTEGSDHIVEAVRELRTDIGIAFNVQPSADIETLFRVKEALVAVMSPRHELAGADVLSLAEVAPFPLAMPPRRSGSRTLIDAACKAAGVSLTPMLESNSLQLLGRFVRETKGIAFLSRLCVLESLRNGEVVAIPLSDQLMSSGTIEALTLAARRLPLAAEEFLRFMRVELEAMGEARA